METIKIEVIGTFQKNPFIKLLIKTFNGKRWYKITYGPELQIVQSENRRVVFLFFLTAELKTHF